jgi:hypothetical protein
MVQIACHAWQDYRLAITRSQALKPIPSLRLLATFAQTALIESLDPSRQIAANQSSLLCGSARGKGDWCGSRRCAARSGIGSFGRRPGRRP